MISTRSILGPFIRIYGWRTTMSTEAVPAPAPASSPAPAPAPTPMPTPTTASEAVIEKLTPPVPEGQEKPINPKLESIVNSITALNLLEVSELSSLLKKKLNLPETAFVPQMLPGNMMMGLANKANEEEEEAVPKKVQTSFKVKLMQFDDKQKIPLIKEIKNLIEGMNLVQAKKFVENIPATVKDDIPKEEAEKLKETLSKVGAIVQIE